MSPTPAENDTPYAGLDPEVVLDALDAVGLRGDGRLIQLNSYENRVFQVFLEDGRVVVAKFYRPGRWSDAQILEEHAFASELAAHEIPLAAPWPLTPDPQSLRAVQVASRGPTLAAFDTVGGPYRFAVTTRMAGRAPEVEDPSVLEWIGRFIGRMHAIGATGRFETRLALNPITYGTEPRDWLLSKDLVPPDALTAWRAMAEAALDQVRAAFDSVTSLKLLRLHGDCHLGNILWTDAGPHFVDLDDAVTGPAVQDLWMLLSGNRAERTRQLGAVLDGYEQFMDFDRRELALIEPLRTLRMIHHSAWIARRWKDPAFPIAFPWFESPSYWMEQATRLRDQLEAMAEAPLVA
ncbi:MAG TPA: serine/threonine protein kinase [Piscinibacter sp.]|nr:serine/threonine protein kinase [Piscinibacter sp.]HOY36145.1 serine/threonine protein kinase [Piscinibacter sp.]